MKGRLEEMRRMNLRVEEFPLESADDIITSISAIGAAVGRPDEGRTAADRVRNKIDELRRASEDRLNQSAHVGSSQRPKALIIVQWDPLIAAGRGSYPDEILQIAGGQNALSDALTPYPVLGAETFLSLEMDAVIDAAEPGENAARNAILSLAKSISGGQAVRIEMSRSIIRPGPRICEAAEELSQAFSRHFPAGREISSARGNASHREEAAPKRVQIP